MEEALKFIGALASLFALYKIIVDVVLARSTKRRDEYDFTKNYLIDLDSEEQHSFVLEKGFFAITGKIYSVPEIRFLLALPNPSYAIKQRGLAASYLEFNENESCYSWRGLYKRGFVRKHGVKWFSIWYFITGSLAIMPIYVQGLSVMANIPVTLFSGSLVLIAGMCVNSQENLKTSKNFMQSLSNNA